MNYEYASDNIIICKNFLPDTMLQKIKIDLMNNRGNFGIPNWSDRAINLFNSKCGGLDYWITEDEIRDGKVPANNESILELNEWFYHQGFTTFVNNYGRLNVFKFLEQKKKTHKIHVISYNNGGYYNWHQDSEFYTFNLILNEGDELYGGDMLFMDDGRTVEIPNQNNIMVVFPTYVHHAITPIKSRSGKDVPFPQQRFSIQYWTDLKYGNY